MRERLRVIIADDERPARSLLKSMLASHDDVELLGEAENGSEAIALIEELRPDLALLDLQMPEIDGLGVVRLLKRNVTPMIAFVTAYDEYAVRAFELNAVDYLLKPVEAARLRETLSRAIDRLDHNDIRTADLARLETAASSMAEGAAPLQRIPVRKRDEIILLPVEQIASIIADGELLHILTVKNEKHTISYRLKDLEARLDGERFIRLGRGSLANVEMITKVHSMPGGTYRISLSNGQELQTSRLHSRILRDRLLRL